MSEQIIKDLARDLSDKISAAYHHAFQLCDDADMAFAVSALGLISAMGTTAGAFDAMSGEEPSADPLSVAKAIIEQMTEARGDKAAEPPTTILANLERQNSDLQAANNRLLERARSAENHSAELRERIARMTMRGSHQSWCALFGETVGWDDGLIHLIEPFIIKLVAQFQEELTRPFSDREREIFKTMVRRAAEAEADAKNWQDLLDANVSSMGKQLADLGAERDDWRDTAKDCAGFVVIHAAQYASDRNMDGLAPVHFDLMTKLGLRMDDFKRAEPEML